ncbi:MAG: molecular chaperone TorD family protein [Piscirickettsiaceae bacterium]|nr:molecular chaperone TorD family protein [Piscirickettsiaceae bacterium]
MSDENTVWRSQTYALLARLLSSPPDQNLLDNIAALEITEAESPMGKLWLLLKNSVKQADVVVIDEEYQRVFIGVTHGEIIPYSSYYQTGFLMEEPLAELRTSLAKLGLVRQKETTEPEDHVAAECDVMRLILDAEGTPVISDKEFFIQHLKPWFAKFFQDLSQIDKTSFYSIVGQFGAGFINLEMSVYR